MSDKLQKPGCKNLSDKEFLIIGIVLFAFAVINIILANFVFRKWHYRK